MKSLRRLLVSSAAFAVICSSVAANAQVKVGDKMPKLKIGNLYNNPYDLDTSDLKGYVVVVEFWATWCGPCIAGIPHLNELYEQYKDQGVLMISLSDEGADKVSPFVKKMTNKMNYLVADGSTSNRDFGVNSIPHAFVIDTQGVVLWRGHPAAGLDEQISQAVKKYKPTRRLGSGPIYNGNLLDKIEKALQKRDYTTARLNMRRLDVDSINVKDKKDELANRYKKAMDAISSSAEADFAQAMKDSSAKRYSEAITTFKMLASDFEGMPIGKKSAAELQKLQDDPAVAKARRGSYNEKLAVNALKRAKRAISAGDKVTAYRRLVALVANYNGTQTAEDAAELIKKLESDEALMKQINADDGG